MTHSPIGPSRRSVVLVYRSAAAGERLPCECGHVNIVPPQLRSARGFCDRCDRPLFYHRPAPARTPVTRPMSYRRPEVKGLPHEPVKECPSCGEKNAMPDDADRATARCHRDQATLFPDLAASQREHWRLPVVSPSGAASSALPAPNPSAVPVRRASAVEPDTRAGRWPSWLIPALTVVVGVLAAVALVLLVLLVLDIAT